MVSSHGKTRPATPENQLKTVSKDSVSSLANSETSDTMCESQVPEDDTLLQKTLKNGEAEPSKTLELKQINLHITKVFIITNQPQFV